MRSNSIIKMLAGGAAAFMLLTSAAFAHHGWNWAEDEQTEMTGTIQEIYIGYPHPRLIIDDRQYTFYPNLLRED